jgi:hypothetical protein
MLFVKSGYKNIRKFIYSKQMMKNLIRFELIFNDGEHARTKVSIELNKVIAFFCR